MTEQLDLMPAEAEETKAPVVMNTEHARAMVRKRFDAPEWACMLEVAPATGGGTRYADAIAVNLWSSRGHAVIGMEIKVSRSDWLRELKKPEKAETSVYRFCDKWYLVAPKGVVKDGELPQTWGLLELRASGLVEVVAAPKLTPEPVTKGFFASLIRRSVEGIEALATHKASQAMREANLRHRELVDREVKDRTRSYAELLEHLKKIEAETGMDFTSDDWRGKRVEAKTIRLAQRLETLESWHGAGAVSRLKALAKTLDDMAKDVREATAATELDQLDANEVKP